MGSRSIPVSDELYQQLVVLAKGIRAASSGVGQFTSPESLAKAFIAYGLEQARAEWYARQASASDRDLRREAMDIVLDTVPCLVPGQCSIKVKEVRAPRPAWGVWVRIDGKRGRRVATLIGTAVA